MAVKNQTTKRLGESLEQWLMRMMSKLRAWGNFNHETHGQEYSDAFKLWAQTYGREGVERAITACREDSDRQDAHFLPAIPILKRYIPRQVRKDERCDRCREEAGWVVVNRNRDGAPNLARCNHDGTLRFFEGWVG